MVRVKNRYYAIQVGGAAASLTEDGLRAAVTEVAASKLDARPAALLTTSFAVCLISPRNRLILLRVYRECDRDMRGVILPGLSPALPGRPSLKLVHVAGSVIQCHRGVCRHLIRDLCGEVALAGK